MSKRGLGKGLDALLATSSRANEKRQAIADSEAMSMQGELCELKISQLRAGKYQPRVDMQEESLQELADSIRSQGIIQPIIVRKLDKKSIEKSLSCDSGQTNLNSDTVCYEIIAGERRFRAAKLAGLKYVPCLVKSVENKAAIAMALIENIQRADLNPIEQSNSLLSIKNEFELTHQEVAQLVGMSRSSVTNLLRLNQLDDYVKKCLISAQIDMGHARALVSLTSEQQIEIAKIVIAKQLTVRQTETLVHNRQNPTEINHKPKVVKHESLEKKLTKMLGAKVKIRQQENGKTKLTMDFDNLQELEAMLNTKLSKN